MSGPLTVASSSSADLRNSLPPWALDALDTPSSESEYESSDILEDDSDPEFADEDEGGTSEDEETPDDTDAEYGDTSEGEERCSDVESTTPSEPDYHCLVEEQPLEALTLFRTLFDERTPGARSRNLRNLLVAVKRATYPAIRLVKDLRGSGEGLTEPGVLNEPFYVQLCALCGHIIHRSRLFDEHPKFVTEFLGLCRYLCEIAWREYQLLPPQTALPPEVVLQRLDFIPPLLVEADAHCDAFKPTSWMEEYLPGSSMKLKEEMHTLLIAIGVLEHQELRFSKASDVHFRSLCMHFYFLTDMKAVDLSDEDMLACSLWSFTPRDDEEDDPSGPDLMEQLENWVRDQCSQYGAKTFLERLCGTLRNPEVVDHRLNMIGPVIGIGLRQPVFRPLFPQTKVLSAIRCAVDRQMSRKDYVDVMDLLNQVCLFIDDYAGTPNDAEHLPERAELLVRHLDAFEIICQAIVNSVNCEGDTAMICTKCLLSFGCMITAMNGMAHASKGLRKYVRKSVKRHWYKTIVDLRGAVKARNSHDETDIDKQVEIIAGWTAFAEEYGLDYDHEEMQYLFELRRTARFCAFAGCEYHAKLPPHPTRACAGCAETRYCSRACQLKDWKDGGHKARCKRLKQTAHASRPR
ncbi:unnamed protein product [Peniophora sp. CBMAI 1063]|nr:unnamed protein product [Peniophora sp. CBMAI 1063]